ncbi:ABC transporter permease [Sphingomonas sp.]|uniref:ABC transporter permease n=1 Tax=Sphingomonas sp. TaxID=28214 RepID=UPI002BF51511|nr:ABC transporter permease [Sphingomonas sp.]HWK36318.1 ABC transporter permease [Sphingomonas sp.]
MSRFRHMIRQTLTVARRDFIATVFTPTFLIFLLAPIIMMSFGMIGGLGAASVAGNSIDKERIIAVVPADEGRALLAADARLRPVFRRGDAPPRLFIEPPAADPAAQARALFDRKDIEASAVLRGPLASPTILYGNREESRADYLARLAEESLRDARVPTTLSVATKQPVHRVVATASGHGQAAFFTVFGIFFLTLLLAGQAVGTMAEERSNKVIEVLAAAVPLESVFLGKLIGMFGVAILFVGFWATIVTNVGALLPAGMARGLADIGPAVGMPAFPLLFFAYFTMSYMLQGAVFLSVGAQASTPREIQLLSLPITIFQVAMFGWAQAAAANPDSWIARGAEIFPFSSPLAMGARAANKPELWPHLLAIGWQLLWVAITIWIGAWLFRRGVLQSGGPKLFRGRSGKVPEAAANIPH